VTEADGGEAEPDAQVQAVMNTIEEIGEALIQEGVENDVVVRGTLLAAMFLGSPLADNNRLAQWLRDTADRIDAGS
jgi:hypothetical protein